MLSQDFLLHFFNIKNQNTLIFTVPGVLMGLFFIYWGIQIYSGKKAELPTPRFLDTLSRKLFGAAYSTQGQLRSFLVGLFSIFLPCGLLYGMIFALATFQDPLMGLLGMFSFWLGTLPMMSFAPSLMKKLLTKVSGTKQTLTSCLLIVFGLSTVIYRLWVQFNPELYCH